MTRSIVVGAGLGGLITAGLLAGRGHAVTLVERSPILGGRSHVLAKDGYTLSYGAHAICAPKAEPVRSIFKELGVELTFTKPSMSKFKLYSDGKLFSTPLGTGAFTTPVIDGFLNHFTFFKQFLQLVKSKPQSDSMASVQEWIDRHCTEPSVAKVIKAYAALTVYDGSLDAYSMNAFAELTNAEYATGAPLAYAGYDELLAKLKQSIVQRGGTILLSTEVTGLVVEGGKVKGVRTKDEAIMADSVILNLPPQAVAKLTDHAALQAELAPILRQAPQYVYVYDVMLSKQLRRDITNILDLDNRVYVNDYSLNVPSSTPEGGQLLSCLRLLTEQEQQDDRHAESSKAAVERILDQVYPGWRNHTIGSRIIHRAMVNGIARRPGYRLLPLRSKSVDSLYFVGDAATGRGGLGLPAYDSAWSVAGLVTAGHSSIRTRHA
jgi:phytoene dehydrogenase-like protein